MKIRYEQLTPREALECYCDWIVARLPHYEQENFAWYRLFYPFRTLLLGAKLLNRNEYAETAWLWMDRYVAEQLPNGAFTADYRHQKTEEMSQEDIENLLRIGSLNLADNGSNVHGLLLGALAANEERKERYIAAARKWLDCWVPIWSLPDGSYGNGIWAGHKLNAPYSMAINVCSAFAVCTQLTGEERYIRNAERFAMFQCDHWHPCGVPIRFHLYPVPDNHTLIGDYSRIYYMLEGLIWTHYVSRNQEVRERIASRLTEWLEADLLKRFKDDRGWFEVGKSKLRNLDFGGYGDSNQDAIGFYWQAAKSCGIPHLFAYYLKYIDDRADLRRCVEQGEAFLCHPLKAHSLSVMGEDIEPVYSIQATGFGGLSVASALDKESIFPTEKKMQRA